MPQPVFAPSHISCSRLPRIAPSPRSRYRAGNRTGWKGARTRMDTIEKYQKYVTTSFVAAVEPIVFDHASGATVVDADGKEYIDCFAGIAVTNAGHRNPKVIDAAKRRWTSSSTPAPHLPRPVGGRAGRAAGRDHARRAAEDLLRQRRRRGHRGRHASGQGATPARSEFISLTHSVPRPHRRDPLDHRQLQRKTRGGPYLPGVAFAPAPYATATRSAPTIPRSATDRAAPRWSSGRSNVPVCRIGVRPSSPSR